jgi:hypothetical protein
MILGIADDGDPASVGVHGVTLRDGFGCVVGSFAVHVRLQQVQQRRNRRLRKNDDVVDTMTPPPVPPVQTRSDRRHRPHRRHRVVVHRDNQAIGLPRSALQVADVAHVREIEAPLANAIVRPASLSARIRSQPFAVTICHSR